MFDQQARPHLARAIAPLARRVPVGPMAITGFALVLGLASATAAAGRWWKAALVLWLVSRLADGLDGVVARNTQANSDFGGYLDFVADMAVYVALPLGIGFGLDDANSWPIIAGLLASFALNVTTLSHFSALLEKRARGANHNSEATAVTMPCGLIEGGETIVIFALVLLLPAIASWLLAAMAVLVTLGAIWRVIRARRLLSDVDASPAVQPSTVQPSTVQT